ncbi:MAG: hypothetical protein WCD37_08875 [Chloroflexia bacterium]
MDDLLLKRDTDQETEGIASAEPVSMNRTKRPFEAPMVLWTEPFQPVAYGMACAKIAGQQFTCDANPNLS